MKKMEEMSAEEMKRTLEILLEKEAKKCRASAKSGKERYWRDEEYRIAKKEKSRVYMAERKARALASAS